MPEALSGWRARLPPRVLAHADAVEGAGDARGTRREREARRIAVKDERVLKPVTGSMRTPCKFVR